MHHQQHKFWILPNTSLTRSFHAPPTAQVLDPAKHKSHKIISCNTNSTSSGSCQTQVSQDHFMHHQQHKFWILPNTSLTRSLHAPPTAQVLDPAKHRSHKIISCTTNSTSSGSCQTQVSQDHFMHHQQHKFWILPNTSLTRSFHAPPTAQVLDPAKHKSHKIISCNTNSTSSGSCQTQVSQDHFMHHQQHKFWILPNTSLTRSLHAPPTAQVLDPAKHKSHKITSCTTNSTSSGSCQTHVSQDHFMHHQQHKFWILPNTSFTRSFHAPPTAQVLDPAKHTSHKIISCTTNSTSSGSCQTHVSQDHFMHHQQHKFWILPNTSLTRSFHAPPTAQVLDPAKHTSHKIISCTTNSTSSGSCQTHVSQDHFMHHQQHKFWILPNTGLTRSFHAPPTAQVLDPAKHKYHKITLCTINSTSSGSWHIQVS